MQSRQRTNRFAMVGAFAVLALGAACGGGDASNGAPSPGDGATTAPATDGAGGGEGLTVVATNLEDFDTQSITATAGQEATLTFDNQQEGVPHNVHIQGLAEDVATEVITGPATTEVTFTPDTAGEFEFICDVHPNMTGTLVVQ